MGERKVLNKYYPPDFDHSKVPRRRQPKNEQIKVTMLPMSIHCNTCGNYIYEGTKFNSRKEVAVGKAYLGIQIVRFYFKCTNCSAEITYKTDPKNSDRVLESGATRNFEPWRAEDEEKEKEKSKRKAEEIGAAMKSLENRKLDSKREMDILAALDEMKSMKSTQANVNIDAMLEVLQSAKEEKERKLNEEDEALIGSIFKGTREKYVRRIDDLEDADGQTSSSKKQMLNEQLNNPSDTLTKIDVLGQGKSEVGGFGDNLNFKTGTFSISDLKKTTSDSTTDKLTDGVQTQTATGGEGNGNVL